MKSVTSNSTPTSTRIASPSTSIWNPSSSMVACCLNSPGQAVQSGSTVQRVVAPAPQSVSPPPPASSSSPGIGPAVCDFHGARRLASPPRGRIYDCSRFDATLRRRRQHAVLEEMHPDNTYSVRTPKTKQSNAAHGWEDVRNLRRGVITRRVTDDTRPGGAPSTGRSSTMVHSNGVIEMKIIVPHGSISSAAISREIAFVQTLRFSSAVQRSRGKLSK